MNDQTTPTSDEPIGALVHRLSEQIPQLVRSEMRLAQAELTQKGKKAGLGIGMFSGPPSPETERLLILVGDGQDGNLAQSEQLVQDAWDDQRIHTYAILIGDNGADYLSQLPRGRGTFKQTSGADLDDLLTSIVTSIPMRLVQ